MMMMVIAQETISISMGNNNNNKLKYLMLSLVGIAFIYEIRSTIHTNPTTRQEQERRKE
jgi:hypothetical protein